MLDDCYSPLKIFHHREHLDLLKSGGHPSPIHVQIIPTNHCNQRCSFCAYRLPGYSSNEDFVEHDQIPVPKIFEIINCCARLGVKAVEITGGGEPTIYPAFSEICSRIASHGIKYGVVSNGVNWTEKNLEALSHASWVRVSIDSANSETYANIRHSTHKTYEKVLENLRTLCSVRKCRSSQIPVIGVGFVLTRDNWSEVLEAAYQARECGADNFRISAIFQSEGADYFNNFFLEASKLCARAQELTNDTFTVFNLFGERICDLKQESPSNSVCPVQRLMTYIGADLNVYRCCVLAYSERGKLGSLAEQSFYNLWHSDEVIGKLDDFDARQCPHCMYNSKNRVIRYALNKSPSHVEFL